MGAERVVEGGENERQLRKGAEKVGDGGRGGVQGDRGKLPDKALQGRVDSLQESLSRGGGVL